MSGASNTPRPRVEQRLRSAVLVMVGLAGGFLVTFGWATMSPPSEHKGLEVEELGFVPEESMAAQVGLTGHKLLLRRITIEPGGQIAKHSAEKTPAVVQMISGSWVEGRNGGETVHNAGDTFIGDKDTVHWFYNRGSQPAAAYVCDIKPAT